MHNIFLILVPSILLLIGCNSKSNSFEVNKKELQDSADTLYKETNIELTESQRNILIGAKENLEENTEYDLSMGYYILTYEDKVNTGNRIYPNGDLDPEIGVCTDVIVRSLRYGGVLDLQKEIHEDIISNKSDYPFSRWGNKKPDTNIDHRRVMNLEVWFSKYWDTISDDNFLPGDIVVWDMNQDGASDHIGIISDTFSGERYKVIHNHPDPGHIAEEDKVFYWKISGHYRISS